MAEIAVKEESNHWLEDESLLMASLGTTWEPDEPRIRDVCSDCERPAKVCWCGFLSQPPLTIQSSIVILQHPNERKRAIKTALMAARGIAAQRCQIFPGRKFPGSHPYLQTLLGDGIVPPNVFILYPGPKATPLSELAGSEIPRPWTFIVLDGTWDEARKLFARNPVLQQLPQVSLDVRQASAYVVRTQPADVCLSTLESVAETLAVVEQDPTLRDRLVQPLHAMCNFQIHHGAVSHNSKQFKEQNSRFVKENNWKKKKSLGNTP